MNVLGRSSIPYFNRYRHQNCRGVIHKILHWHNPLRSLSLLVLLGPVFRPWYSFTSTPSFASASPIFSWNSWSRRAWTPRKKLTWIGESRDEPNEIVLLRICCKSSMVAVEAQDIISYGVRELVDPDKLG
jgi:hypothetical protein